MALYLANFSRLKGSKDKKPRKRNFYLSELMKLSVKAGAFGTGGFVAGALYNRTNKDNLAAVKYRESLLNKNILTTKNLPRTAEADSLIRATWLKNKTPKLYENYVKISQNPELENKMNAVGTKWGKKARLAALGSLGSLAVLKAIKEHKLAKKDREAI